MTEELKQKAEEWCLNHTFADTDSAEGIRLQNAYIAGAEPREKRIADLEKKNAELKNRNAELKGMYAHSAREAGTYKQFLEAKEKENAELKEKYAKNITDCDICDTYCNSQLTKAKEIIKTFCGFCSVFNSTNGSFDNLIAEAEQFLSEVEK